METTCPSCHSCGMALEKASDHALGDLRQLYCVHCVNEQGLLKPYKEILDGMVSYLIHSQGLAKESAEEIAKDTLVKQPVWQDKSACDS